MNDVTIAFWARLAWVQGWPEAHHSQKHQRPSCGMTDMLMESSETHSREDPLSQYICHLLLWLHTYLVVKYIHSEVHKDSLISDILYKCSTVSQVMKSQPWAWQWGYAICVSIHATCMCKLTTQNTANILNSNPRINFTQGFTPIIQWPGMPWELSPHRLTPAVQRYIPWSSPCRSTYASRHPGILNFPIHAGYTPPIQWDVPQSSTHRLYSSYTMRNPTILHTQAIPHLWDIPQIILHIQAILCNKTFHNPSHTGWKLWDSPAKHMYLYFM